MWLHDVLNGMHRSAGGRDQKFRMTMTYYFESKTQRDFFFLLKKRGSESCMHSVRVAQQLN